MFKFKPLQLEKSKLLSTVFERRVGNANEEKTVSSQFLHCMCYYAMNTGNDSVTRNVFKVLWTLFLIGYPLFGSSGDLGLNIGFTILSNTYCPSNVFVVVQNCQHITYMIGIIWKGVLFWTVVQESVAEEIFNGPGLSAVGVVFQRPTPLSVCN